MKLKQDHWLFLAPKTDLHCHLDGSLRVSTILDLAKQQNVTLPATTEAELFSKIYAGDVASSLTDYLKGFNITLKVLQNKAALYRVAYELIEDCAKENVRYIEVRYAPTLHQELGLSLEAIVESVLLGLEHGRRDFGVLSGVILCALRSMPVASSIETARLAVAYKMRGVVAFDLAGDEAHFPAKDHKQAFELARVEGLPCTIHAGEAAGPKSISDALFLCGAHRIGHGTNLFENYELEQYVLDFQVPLEICLSSNLQTGACLAISNHPFVSYFKKGLLVTLNTDNRLVTNTTSSLELQIAQDTFGYSNDQMKTIIKNGVQAAFLPFAEKQALLRSFSSELERF